MTPSARALVPCTTLHLHSSAYTFCSHFPCFRFSMAPKRKRAGQTRMDAALDHMTTMGFSKPLVRKTVKNLLQVYGTDGWRLIEEDAYKVLLDVILDEQEAELKNNLLKDASSSKIADEDALIQGNAIASLTVDAESSEVPSLSIKGHMNQECLKDSDLDKNDLRSSQSHNDDDHSATEVNLQDSENAFLSLRVSDAVHAPVSAYTRSRKPCYGWISDDEDDNNDTKFIELPPAT